MPACSVVTAIAGCSLLIDNPVVALATEITGVELSVLPVWV